MSGVGEKSTVARGRSAEAIAAEYYKSSGCEILRMNYRIRGGEIDIIARDGEYIAFIEVKMRKSDDYGAPADAVDTKKQRRICRTALHYAAENGFTEEPMRFDVCEICGDSINVIENAFDYIE